MLNSFAEGLQLLTPSVIGYIAFGAVICSLITLLPGSSGTLALVILLPVAYTAPTTEALAMLVSVASVTGTANTVTGVLFGIPSTAAGVAVTFDGYPLTQRGEGIRAVTAGLVTALVGGVIGAIALAVLLPVTEPIVLAVGPAEFFALVLLALVLIATIGRGQTGKALVSGGLGIMLSFIGQQPSSGVTRFTGGWLYLFDGIPLVPVMIGLFAVAEMLNLARNPKASIGGESQTGPVAAHQVRRGILDVFVHWPIWAVGSLIGVVVGLIPGLGSTAAQFMSYAQAARMSKNRDNFGKGAIEGVIAADAATNSKEGGALLPTFAFGIPGSESSVILLTALITVGVQPGPTFYTEHADLLWLFVITLIVAHAVATLFVSAIVKPVQTLTRMRLALVVPLILSIALWGAFSATRAWGDIVIALGAGVVGYFIQKAGYSRANLVIGFVLGILLENNYYLAKQVSGWEFLLRPGTLGVLLFTAAILAASVVVQLVRRSRSSRPSATVT